MKILSHLLFISLFFSGGSDIVALEVAILQEVQGARAVEIDKLILFITVTTYGFCLLVPVLLYLYGRLRQLETLKRKAYQVVFSLVLNTVVVGVLKYLINRPRPFVSASTVEQLASAGSPSFPSGHTACAFVVAASLCFLFQERQLRFLVCLWAATVAYSRLVLGVHYPTDVLGSVLIGTLCAFAGQRVFAKSRVSYLPWL